MSTRQIPSVDSDTLLLPDAVRHAQERRNASMQPQSAFAASKWFNALSRVRMGTGNAKLLCVGDSTTAGFGATRASSWPSLVQQRLNLDIAAVPGLAIGMGLDVDSARWSYGDWTFNFGPGGSGLYANAGSGADAVFTPGITVDTIDVWWFQGAGKGSFVVTIDGAPQTPIDTTGGSGIYQKTTYTVPVGNSHTIALQLPTGNPVNILGVDAYLSSKNSVRVANWGVSGSITDTWVNAFYSLNAISSYAPDLTIVMLGINDSANGVSVDTWSSNMTAIINEAKKSGDVIVMSVFPSNATMVDSQRLYRDRAQVLAAELDAGFIDLMDKIGAYSEDTYADALHPNARGYADIARYVIAGLRAL